ncbi:hypothetical protein B0H14DRAFT_2577512 [Mycena olivaceomarginata]|nr:hypothetical protein B0H14DRAFT_2608494 [Mycena olivaceomarginata]KAJ7809142.1 hypothetical protein B0H14DRAFT_2608309 [Mycena olivaceomarginata]KAJ7858951.1 hypothetical protein B0H14DRAFT_2577512 [Mycena olivaceomarginata]
MAATKIFRGMKDSINAGLANLEKWYSKTDDTDVYFICLALDPNFKTAYAEASWNSIAYEEGLAEFEMVVRFPELRRLQCLTVVCQFDDYYVAPHSEAAEVATAHKLPTLPVQYGHSWMQAKVQARKNNDFAAVNPRDELKTYLKAPLQTVDGVVG